MKTLLVFLGLFVFLIPIQAQENTVTISISGAYDISVPDDWEIDSKTNTGYYWLMGDSIVRVRTYTPYFLFDYAGFVDPEATEILEWIVTDAFLVRDFDTNQVEEHQLGGYVSYSYRFDYLDAGQSIPHVLHITDLDDGTLILSYIRAQDGSELNENDVDELATTLGSISRRDRYVFYDGATFDISNSDWQILEEYTLGIAGVTLSNERVALDVSYWPRYAAIAGLEIPRDFLGFLWDANYREYGRYDRSVAENTQVAGFDGLFYPFTTETLNDREMYSRGVFVFELTANETYVTIVVMSEDTDNDYDEIYGVIDTFEAGNRIVCPLFADPGVSIRAEASTSSTRVRQTNDEVLIAEYDTTGADGYRWFNVGEGWIRSDVIFFELNTCEGLSSR